MIMKNTLLLTIVGILLILLATGCDRRGTDLTVPFNYQDVTSDDANWVLSLSLVTDIDYIETFVNLYYTQEVTSEMLDDSVAVVLDGIQYPMIIHYPDTDPFWGNSISSELNYLSNIQLFINGERILNTNVKPIDRVSAAFPASYNWTLPLTLNWAVSGSNQYQFVRAASFNESGPVTNYTSTFIDQVSSGARSYRFPEYCIEVILSDSVNVYDQLMVKEVNYKIVSRVAIMQTHTDAENYGVPGLADKYIDTKDDIMLTHRLLSRQVRTRSE
jgi:hypothetical protein